MNGQPTLTERIALTERRLEMRREQSVRYEREIRGELERARKWLPLAAGVAAAAIGFAAARNRFSAAPVDAQTQVARRPWLSALLAVAGMITRLASSASGRALWASLRK